MEQGCFTLVSFLIDKSSAGQITAGCFGGLQALQKSCFSRPTRRLRRRVGRERCIWERRPEGTRPLPNPHRVRHVHEEVSKMRIVDLQPDDETAIQQIAAMLVAGFGENWPGAWPDLDSALEEVRESFGADRI